MGGANQRRGCQQTAVLNFSVNVNTTKLLGNDAVENIDRGWVFWIHSTSCLGTKCIKEGAGDAETLKNNFRVFVLNRFFEEISDLCCKVSEIGWPRFFKTLGTEKSSQDSKWANCWLETWPVINSFLKLRPDVSEVLIKLKLCKKSVSWKRIDCSNFDLHVFALHGLGQYLDNYNLLSLKVFAHAQLSLDGWLSV